MANKTSFIISLYVVFAFVSPFFLILLQNYPILFEMKTDTIFDHKPTLIDEINTLRGETLDYNTGFLGKSVVNKYTIFTQEMAKRYFGSFDPGFLFFNGGIDRFTSTGETGQLPLSFLPLLLIGIYYLLSEGKITSRIILSLLAVFPGISAFYYDKWALLPRVPMLFLVLYICVLGFTKLMTKKRFLVILFAILVFSESVLIYHKFANHYTNSIIEQKYKIQ